MRRQWLMALGVDVAIMGSVAVILALISADVLPASLMAPVIVVGMLLIQFVLELTRVPRILVSDFDVKEGVLAEMAG